MDSIYDFGLSVRRQRLTKPDDLVNWLNEVLEVLVPNEPVRLVGLSYGGWLASQYALRYPARLRKIVLLAPAATVLRVSLTLIFKALLTVIPHTDFRKRFYYWLLRDMVQSGEIGQAQVDEAVADWEVAERCFRPLPTVIATVLEDKALQRFGVPCLFLVGENEKIYSARKAVKRLYRVAPQIQTEIIPHAGHDLSVVQADLVTRKILDFFGCRCERNLIMRHNAVRLTVCGILLVMAACASQPSPTLTPTPNPTAIPPELISGIDAWLSQQSKDGNFSGSVLVARQGDVLLSQGYGLADREQNIPNTAQTRFRLGSITKQFTAMATLILDARGKLNVKDPICNYIADCPSTWEGITIDHLLTHTSGIPDLISLTDYRSTLATPSPPQQTIARFKDLPLDFQPGEQWSYSNSGYIVLGYIIEQVSGQSYEDFLQQSIFTSLNLRDTGYDHNSTSLAVGYPDQYSTLPAEFIDMSIPYAAGGLYSTVEDLYRWEQALSTEQLVPRDYLNDIFAPHAAIRESLGWAYGYGWFIGKERGRLIHMHEGGIPGFSTIIARYPDDQVTIIVLSNQENTDVKSLQDFLSNKIFGDQ